MFDHITVIYEIYHIIILILYSPFCKDFVGKAGGKRKEFLDVLCYSKAKEKIGEERRWREILQTEYRSCH